MIPAYPLEWPTGWPRATSRKSAAFSVGARSFMAGARPSRTLSVADGLERVLLELTRLHVDRNDIVVSTNVALRLDGYPRSNLPEPGDPGAAVYWELKGKRQVLAIDRYDRVADNLAAVAATLEALRAIERHGGGLILERAFTGFVALPAPSRTAHWSEVLNVDPGASPEEIREAWRTAAMAAHPDRDGGSHERMARINQARDRALEERT